MFLNAKSSLSLWSKWQIGHVKGFLNTNLFLIKPFLITKFDWTIGFLKKLVALNLCLTHCKWHLLIKNGGTRKWIDVPIHIPLLPRPNSKSANNVQGRQIDIMTYRPAWKGLCYNLRCGLHFLSSQQVGLATGGPHYEDPLSEVKSIKRKQVVLSFLEGYNKKELILLVGV